MESNLSNNLFPHNEFISEVKIIKDREEEADIKEIEGKSGNQNKVLSSHIHFFNNYWEILKNRFDKKSHKCLYLIMKA